MKPDPSLDEYKSRWAATYEHANYERGLAAYFLRQSHQWCERRFGSGDRFARVLEVGAGTGVHLSAVRHQFDEYWLTDADPQLLEQGRDRLRLDDARVRVQAEDATRLSFADGSFDRLIATHVLEHLPQPHRVLREWVRVVRPGGVLSLVLPCDPGLAWRCGRRLGPRRALLRQGLPYDYWMAREHINPLHNLLAYLRYYFDDIEEDWRPLRLPSIDLNLFYIAHVRR